MLQRSEAREGVRSITEEVGPESCQIEYQATLVGSSPYKAQASLCPPALLDSYTDGVPP